jgi:hypothetical protein
MTGSATIQAISFKYPLIQRITRPFSATTRSMKDYSMRSLLSVTLFALVASTGLVLTPALAVDTSISDKCGPDAPEGYKRPGGYCEQIGSNGLLTGSDSRGADDEVFNDGPEDQ